MFLSFEQKSENNVYPCKPQFYYIKVGFKGVKIIYRYVFVTILPEIEALCLGQSWDNLLYFNILQENYVFGTFLWTANKLRAQLFKSNDVVS